MEKNNRKKIIAVVGMAGAGKSEATNYLLKKLNCPKVYFGEVTFDRMKEDGLALNYENEKITREKIRAEHGMGAYAKFSLPKISKFLESNDFVVLESLYSWEEYLIIKENFRDDFLVLAIFTSSDIRLARLKNREHRPIENKEDLTKRDIAEIEGTNKGGPIAVADFTILNEETVEKLHQNLENFLRKFKIL